MLEARTVLELAWLSLLSVEILISLLLVGWGTALPKLGVLRLLMGLVLATLLTQAWPGVRGPKYTLLLLTVSAYLYSGALLATHPTLRADAAAPVTWRLSLWVGFFLAVWTGGYALLCADGWPLAYRCVCPTTRYGPTLFAVGTTMVFLPVPAWVEGAGRRRAWRWFQRTGRVGAGGMLVVGGVSWWMATGVVDRIHHDGQSAPPRTVAIVPGALVYAGGVPSATLRDRLATARDLYRQGKVQRILVSGDHCRPDYDEVNPSRRWLLRQGVPSAHILLDHAGLRTLDTMIRAREIFGVLDAVICTQAFHLPRAVYLARRAGINAVGVVADRRIYRTVRHTNRLRELAARAKAFLDTHLLHTRPRFTGSPIPLLGDTRLTHDRWTQP